MRAAYAGGDNTAPTKRHAHHSHTHQLLLLHCADHYRTPLGVCCQVLSRDNAAAAGLAEGLHMHRLKLHVKCVRVRSARN